MPRRKKIRKAVRTISERPSIHGRKVRKGRHLNINAPTSDFCPIPPISAYKKKH